VLPALDVIPPELGGNTAGGAFSPQPLLRNAMNSGVTQRGRELTLGERVSWRFTPIYWWAGTKTLPQLLGGGTPDQPRGIVPS
jgi:hypothetical protein